MGQEDLYQIDFFEDKNRFSDAFNGALFHGKEVMKPEELDVRISVVVRSCKCSKLFTYQKS